MKYISTRGQVAPIGFIDAVLMGLADDGGLLVPDHIPQLTDATLKQWQHLAYPELALEIFSLFVNDEIPRVELKKLIDHSYAVFRHEDITPVRRMNNNLYIMELFHGPTFAFKDIALQFLGHLYEYISNDRNSIIHILGATSGDTGASAIEGVRGKAGIRICILHPYQKVSKVQQLQMITVTDENVLNLAVDGNFDDCQRIIKDLFADIAFKHNYHLRAVNSINIARVLAQTVYYFYAYFQLANNGLTDKNQVNISVPTGNFGNIFAGYLARRMGLPINKLILATNENNILARFVGDGVYEPGAFQETYSPSMDIQAASNFERYLFYLNEGDADKVTALMTQFKTNSRFEISKQLLKNVQTDFSAYSVNNQDCLHTVSDYYAKYDYLLDPHTACGVAAADNLTADGEITICLATAHPSKFNEAIQLLHIAQTFPKPIEALFNKRQKQTLVGNSNEEIKAQLLSFYEHNNEIKGGVHHNEKN